MARVTGIGGVFFKGRNEAGPLGAWYQKHLGIPLESLGGAILKWPDDKAEDGGMTVWHVADQASEWFHPSDSSFMINYRVDDLDGDARAASRRRGGSRRWARIAREREVRLDHGSGREQGGAVGAQDRGTRRTRKDRAQSAYVVPMLYAVMPTPLWTEKRPAGS